MRAASEATLSLSERVSADETHKAMNDRYECAYVHRVNFGLPAPRNNTSARSPLHIQTPFCSHTDPRATVDLLDQIWMTIIDASSVSDEPLTLVD